MEVTFNSLIAPNSFQPRPLEASSPPQSISNHVTPLLPSCNNIGSKDS